MFLFTGGSKSAVLASNYSSAGLVDSSKTKVDGTIRVNQTQLATRCSSTSLDGPRRSLPPNPDTAADKQWDRDIGTVKTSLENNAYQSEIFQVQTRDNSNVESVHEKPMVSHLYCVHACFCLFVFSIV